MPDDHAGRGSWRPRLVDRVHGLDERIDATLDAYRTPAADRVFFPLSSIADHSVLWVLLAAGRSALGDSHARPFVQTVAVLGAESFVTNIVVKSFFRRTRPVEPTEIDGPLPYKMRKPTTSAFPSGHAAAAFTASALLARGDPATSGYFALATLVAMSRVYVRLHHPSDVVAGAGLGFAFGRLARAFLDR